MAKTWQRLHQQPQLWEQYFVRERVIKAIRSFFDHELFHEVETPLLVGYPPAESYVDVFETSLLDRQRQATPAYLTTSPEMSLKKLLVAGIGNCYTITKSFRNTEVQSYRHNPEFTILEWYRVNGDYRTIMDDCERLHRYIAQSLGRGEYIEYQGQQIDLRAPWEKLSVAAAFEKYAQVSLDDFFDKNRWSTIARSKGYTVESTDTWEMLYNQIFLNEIEPKLGFGKPTILFDYPSSMAALSRKKADDPRYAERFEYYIAGLELGNAFTELTDATEQEQRFEAEMKELQRKGRATYTYDQDFIAALRVGLPACGGIAVGVDRLVMLFANVPSIRDTLFFPYEDLFDVTG